MATQVQFRRGTTSQNNAFTGAIGEITYDTEVKTLRLHDGSSSGGGATVATLADEVDPEDIYDWILPIKHLSTLIPYFAHKLKGLSFDDYPNKQWTNGIFDFINKISEYEGSSGNVYETTHNITKLKRSIFNKNFTRRCYYLKKASNFIVRN
jgi:hypothetical protein